MDLKATNSTNLGQGPGKPENNREEKGIEGTIGRNGNWEEWELGGMGIGRNGNWEEWKLGGMGIGKWRN